MATDLVPHRFTVAEYYRMAEAGILDEDSRVELIDGRIIQMSPINARHATAVDRCLEAFAGLVRAGRVILRVQNPLRLGRYNEPQPDVALVRSRPDRYVTGHPRAASVLLLIEVADSSLEYDRRHKLPLYAGARIREAWVLNLPERLLEVHQEPGPDGHAVSRVYRPGERVVPLAFPDLEIAVDDLLPPGIASERQG
jgi:Uma2 family endonuclease